MKTLKIKEETHKELTKILGEVTAQKGSIATYDEAITALIKEWRKTH